MEEQRKCPYYGDENYPYAEEFCIFVEQDMECEGCSCSVGQDDC